MRVATVTVCAPISPWEVGGIACEDVARLSRYKNVSSTGFGLAANALGLREFWVCAMAAQTDPSCVAACFAQVCLLPLQGRIVFDTFYLLPERRRDRCFFTCSIGCPGAAGVAKEIFLKTAGSQSKSVRLRQPGISWHDIQDDQDQFENTQLPSRTGGLPK